MFDFPPIILASGAAWSLAWATVLGLTVNEALKRRRQGEHVGRLWFRTNASLLLAVSPVVAQIQHHFAQRIGGGVVMLCVGLAFLVLSWLPAHRRATDDAREPVMSFREKSAAVNIAAIVLVYGYYSLKLWGTPPGVVAAIGLLIGSTVLMILITVAAHIGIAIYTRPEHRDERDRIVALRSVRNGYGILSVGIWAVLMLAMAGAQPAALAYAALGAFVLAELVRLISVLAYYRFPA